MRVRVLSEWAGSGRCGEVCDVPEPVALDRVRTGWAEFVHDAQVPVFETAIVPPVVEMAVAPVTPPRRRGRPPKVRE